MNEPTRIVLIDDDVVTLEAMALGLRQAGYEVLVAPGAAAGLDLLRRVGASVIVTDMNMPGTSGAALISRVRVDWPELPIIAMSGSLSPDGLSMLNDARALGADALLPKPFRVAQLKEALERVLAASQGG